MPASPHTRAFRRLSSMSATRPGATSSRARQRRRRHRRARGGGGAGGDPRPSTASTSSNPEAPTARTAARISPASSTGRLTHPRWIASQLAHGWRGAAELAEAVDTLFVFAASTGCRSPMVDCSMRLFFRLDCADSVRSGRRRWKVPTPRRPPRSKIASSTGGSRTARALDQPPQRDAGRRTDAARPRNERVPPRPSRRPAPPRLVPEPGPARCRPATGSSRASTRRSAC